MMRYTLLLLLVLIMLIGCATPPEEIFTVIQVIDGDTFEIETGQRVRLICINTPEIDEPGYEQATSFLKAYLEGKKVQLVKDKKSRDSFGRLLRYAYDENGTFVNAYIVREGKGKAVPYAPNIEKCPDILEAEQEAQQMKKGLWSS